jgi:hypothetical protein
LKLAHPKHFPILPLTKYAGPGYFWGDEKNAFSEIPAKSSIHIMYVEHRKEWKEILDAPTSIHTTALTRRRICIARIVCSIS